MNRKLNSAERERLDAYRATVRARRETAPKRRVWTRYRLSDVPGELTEAGLAYLNRSARRMAYQAVKTTYASSADPMMYTLMQYATADYHRLLIDEGRDIATPGEIDHNGNYQEVEAMQQSVVHSYKVVHDIRLPVMPYTTLELTATGRELMQYDTGCATDFDDLVSVAVVTLIELSDVGMLTDYESVWQCKRYVYKAITDYINRHRRIQRELAEYDAYTTGDAASYTDTALEEIDLSDAVQCACDYVRDRCKHDADTTVAVLALKVNGRTVRSIADLLDMSKSAVDRHYRKAIAILDTPDGRAFLQAIFYN